MSNSLLSRRLRTISTASLPSDFAFSSASSDSKKSSTMSLPSLVDRSPVTSRSARLTIGGGGARRGTNGVFLPLLPLGSSDDETDLVKSSSPTGSAASSEDPEQLLDDEDDDDRASDAAFSDIASSPTTPSEASLMLDDVDDADVEPLDTAFSDDFLLSPAHLKSLQHHAFSLLSPSDFPFLLSSSRLLTLRDSLPALCAGEAMETIENVAAPRCWRARAGVYRAESLWKLGLEQEARRELGYAERMLHDGPVAQDGGEGQKLMEALVGWNIHVGKMNWGMYDDHAPLAPSTGAESNGLGIDLAEPAVEALDLHVPAPAA